MGLVIKAHWEITMRITKNRLKQIIKEELAKVLREDWQDDARSRSEAEHHGHGYGDASGGTVVVKGLRAGRTEDYRDVTVLLDGKPISVTQIFDDLDEKHPEYQGWKSNVDPEGWDNFMSDQIFSGPQEWAEMNGYRFERPDY